MKFIVDAQLPRRATDWLAANGHDAIHTFDLPLKNRTSDQQIIEVATRENRVVITKDADFVDSHLLYGRPAKLVFVSTGNITNDELASLWSPLLDELAVQLNYYSFIEIARSGLVARG